MDRPPVTTIPAPLDPRERQLRMARWLSQQVAPPWSPQEPVAALEFGLAAQVTFPDRARDPRGFFGAVAPLASAAARWAGPVFATEVRTMAWADSHTLVCGGHDGQAFAMQIDDHQSLWWPRLLGRQRGPITQIVTVHGGLALAADQTGTVCLWSLDDPAAAGPQAELVAAPDDPAAPAVWDLAIDASRGLVAAACDDGSLRLWPLSARGRTVPRSARDSRAEHAAREPAMRRLAFDGEAGVLAGANEAGEIAWWSLASGTDPLQLQQVQETRAGMPLLLAPLGDGLWVSVHGDGTRIWRAGPHNTPPVWLQTERSAVVAAALHRDSRRLAWAFGDGQMSLCDLGATPGSRFVTVRAHERAVEALAFVAGGGRLASLADGEAVKLWDASAPVQALAGFHLGGSGVRRLAPSPDAHWLGGAGDGPDLRLWQTEPVTPNAWRFAGWAATQPLRLVARGEGESPLATAAEDGSVWLWPASVDTALPRRVEAAGTTGLLGCLEVTRDGRYALAGRPDGSLSRIDLASAPGVGDSTSAKGHAAVLSCLALDADGQQVASGAADGSIATWAIEDPRGPERRLHWPAHEAPVRRLRFVPGKRRLISADANGRLRAWQFADSSAPVRASDVQAHEGRLTSLAVGADARVLLSTGADGRLKHWRIGDDATLEPLQAWDAHRDGASHVVYDGQRLAYTVGIDGHLRGWALDRPGAGKPLVDWVAHAAAVRDLALAPDLKFAATASDDGSVKLWALSQPDHAEPACTWRLHRPVRRLLWRGSHVVVRFEGGFCAWRASATQASDWQWIALVLQLDAGTLLRLTHEGIELIRDQPLHTARDAAGRLLPADPQAFGQLRFVDRLQAEGDTVTRVV